MTEPSSSNPAAGRVWRQLPPSVRERLELLLPPADLRSLLLDVADARAIACDRVSSSARGGVIDSSGLERLILVA